MMPFLGLVATQRGKYDYYSKSCGRSYLPYYSIRVSLVLNLSKCGQVSHELMKASITLLALYIWIWTVGAILISLEDIY